jgi:hypothetical protein
MKSKTYILGIDPGNKGACALLSLDGSEIDWFKIPTKVEVEGTERRIIDAKLLKEHLENFDILTCYIEKQAYKNAKLNANYGICLAVLMILGIDYLPIQSASWMCSLKATEGLEDVRQGTSKDFTFYAFEKIFPDVVLPRKGKLLDDDIADACLLAWLCYRKIDLASD